MFEFLSLLFQNPGKKLKNVALVVFILFAAGGIITGFYLFSDFSEYQLKAFGYSIIFPLLFGSIPAAWLIALPLSAFGELVEKATWADRRVVRAPSAPVENRTPSRPAALASSDHESAYQDAGKHLNVEENRSASGQAKEESKELPGHEEADKLVEVCVKRTEEEKSDSTTAKTPPAALSIFATRRRIRSPRRRAKCLNAYFID